MLQTRLIPSAENAHAYPLLIKRLLLSGSRYEKTREIVYRDWPTCSVRPGSRLVIPWQ